jgi:large subunit ribosomal protein L19
MKAQGYTKETILDLGISERNFPEFRSGDTICVTLRVKEGAKERLQDFEGVVMGSKGKGITKTFRIRKIADGIAVEKIFPYYAPVISSIKLIKQGVVRRTKLYYLRSKKGRDAEIPTKQKTAEQKKEAADLKLKRSQKANVTA